MLGYLDDIILLPMLVALTIKFISQDVLERNRKQAEGMWQDGKPKKWYYAIPVVAIWIIIIGLSLKVIFGGSFITIWGLLILFEKYLKKKTTEFWLLKNKENIKIVLKVNNLTMYTSIKSKIWLV